MDLSFDKEFRLPLFSFSLNTKTTKEQNDTEELVSETYYQKIDKFKHNFKKLYSVIHVKFIKNLLLELSPSYESLDASQTWIIYWTLHSLKLLNYIIPEKLKTSILSKLASCQDINGGFGGGPFQLGHLATTYGAVLALVELEDPKAFDIINRDELYNWLMSLKNEDCSFNMHKGGEVDVRGCYCATTVAKLCGLNCDELFNGTAKWIASCQTYEGGFGGIPGLEAHGGYTFCAVAALIQLDSLYLIDRNRLLKWCLSKQMSSEGGFQGRTNKLVDSCYSFWVAAVIPLLNLSQYSPSVLYDVNALEEYLLGCCQKLSGPIDNPNGGGFIDKPGKYPDPYHTCYSLSGLAVAQQYYTFNYNLFNDTNDGKCPSEFDDQHRILSSKRSFYCSCDLEPVNGIYNVTKSALEYHSKQFNLHFPNTF